MHSIYKVYLLLVGELIVAITLEPQSVHNSGVQCDHQCQEKKYHDQPRHSISFPHPLLRPDRPAGVAALLLLNVLDKEHWDIKYKTDDPASRNNYLKF